MLSVAGRAIFLFHTVCHTFAQALDFGIRDLGVLLAICFLLSWPPPLAFWDLSLHASHSHHPTHLSAGLFHLFDPLDPLEISSSVSYVKLGLIVSW